MTDHDVHLAALFGRPPTDDERAAATAQAARLEAGITDNPILRRGVGSENAAQRPVELIDLPRFSVPAP